VEVLGRVDVPAEPVLSAAEARSHPQAIERAVLSAGPDRLPRLAFPARFDGERPAPGGATPELGEHTRPILAELGVPRDVETSPGVGRRFSLKRWLRTVLR
jgi:crotonobetainyl-CoA:carnitine CoA-transferase CaiB-like acyl-CoA transferase